MILYYILKPLVILLNIKQQENHLIIHLQLILIFFMPTG